MKTIVITEKVTAENVQQGQIFSYSWGCEQTSVYWFELVSLSPSRKSGMFCRLESIKTSDGPQTMTGKTVPDVGNYMKGKEPFRKRLQEYQDELYIVMDYGSLRAWNGKPKRFSTYG